MPATRSPGLTRRQLLAASAGLATLPVSGARPAPAQAGPPVSVTIAEQGLKLQTDGAEIRVPLADPAFAGRFRVSDALQFQVKNTLNVPFFAHFRGFIRAPEPKPEVRPAIAANGGQTYTLRTARPGTMLAEFGPARAPFVVEEVTPPQVDRDEVMLIEEWRVRGDGSLVPPGTDPAGATTVFTLNRKLAPEIAVRRFERLRFRFINGSQRSVFALRIENANAPREQALRVIAVDSRPSEPFPARNGQIALAPTSRLDALVDASGEAGSTATLLLHDGASARPLARLVYGSEPMRSAALPEAPPLSDTGATPNLRNAQRFELVFDGTDRRIDRPGRQPDGSFTVIPNPPPSTRQPATTGPVAFRAHRNRTVSLALTNKSGKPAIFRLHDHSARLLDRMDDGWKPYWVDTIPVDVGQTQRIAFVPENSGTFIIDAFAPEWGSVQRRWGFVVEV